MRSWGVIDGPSLTVLRYRRPARTDRTLGRHLLLQAGAGLVVGSGAGGGWRERLSSVLDIRSIRP